jgi:hypothetical protein
VYASICDKRIFYLSPFMRTIWHISLSLSLSLTFSLAKPTRNMIKKIIAQGQVNLVESFFIIKIAQEWLTKCDFIEYTVILSKLDKIWNISRIWPNLLRWKYCVWSLSFFSCLANWEREIVLSCGCGIILISGQ